ncbi:MAG: alpha/beta hydrolase [Thermomicrobiales bacterium]|nr:alpha/beta hydrolase [Thermomicrobiales bacterium]
MIHIVERPDYSIAYTWHAQTSSRPLVMLHGLGDSSIHTMSHILDFEPLQGVSALLIDAPGFGLSTATENYPATIDAHADAIVGLLDDLGVRGSYTFGHSMGANIAIEIARSRPDIVARLTLAEPLLHPNHSVLATQIARFTEESYVARGHAMMMRATSMQASRGDVAAIAFLPVLELADPRVMYRSAVSLLTPREPSFLEALTGLPQPTTLMVGEHSGARRLADLPPSVPHAVIANAGHSMHIEQPNATAYAILETDGHLDLPPIFHSL